MHDTKHHVEEQHCTIPNIMWKSNIARYQTPSRRATLHDTKHHVDYQHCTIPNSMWKSNITRYQTACGGATLHDSKQHVAEQHCTIPNNMCKINIARYQTSCGRATLHDTKQHMEEQHYTIPNSMLNNTFPNIKVLLITAAYSLLKVHTLLLLLVFAYMTLLKSLHASLDCQIGGLTYRAYFQFVYDSCPVCTHM